MNHLIIFKLVYCVNKFSVIAKYTEDQTGLHLILMSQMHICVLFLSGPERTDGGFGTTWVVWPVCNLSYGYHSDPNIGRKEMLTIHYKLYT